jgi:hypothetical protein
MEDVLSFDAMFFVYVERYVCWTAYLMRHHGKSGHMEPVALPGAPFSHYYSQEASDEGIIMETDIAVKEVSNHLIVCCCNRQTDRQTQRKNIWSDTFCRLTFTSDTKSTF